MQKCTLLYQIYLAYANEHTVICYYRLLEIGNRQYKLGTAPNWAYASFKLLRPTTMPNWLIGVSEEASVAL